MNFTEFRYIADLIKRFPELVPVQSILHQAVRLLEDAVRNNGKVLVCGNGGSAADAEHIVGELMKSFLIKRKLSHLNRQRLERFLGENDNDIIPNLQQPIPAISLVSGLSFPTAYANDVGSDHVFAQQVLALGSEGDVLWTLSTSGQSRNILNAMKVSKALGLKTILLTGAQSGPGRPFCDVEITVPRRQTYLIQEIHTPVYHAICADLEFQLYGEHTPT